MRTISTDSYCDTKSGSDWTANELFAYNITVKTASRDEFFLNPDPPINHIDPDILNSPPEDNTNPNISLTSSLYLAYLDLAAKATQESFIDDFAAETLKLLEFNGRGITVSSRFIIPFTICGESTRAAQTDVCLIHNPTFVLLVLVEDKTLSNRTDAQSQVIAEAIATFQYNNGKREERGLDPLPTMTIPCITMNGTRPTFYLVPVTKELSKAVITGQYPDTETVVLKCATAGRRASTGMEDKDYRRLAFKSFLAFKELARSHWSHFLEGV